MTAALGFVVLGMFAWQATDPPDISGRWTGEEWGHVVLEQKQPGTYEGTYTDTFGKESGGLELKWSRIERRFKGTWREGKERFGTIAVRKVGDEIRGAWTTNKESRIQPGTPELADLLWRRNGKKAGDPRSSPRWQTGKILEQKLEATTNMPQRLVNLQIGDRVETIACSGDGKLMAIANGNPTRILRVDGTSRVKDNWKPTVRIMEAMPDFGERLVVRLVLTTAEEDIVLAATPRISHVEATSLAFSPDASLLAVGTSIGQVKLFDAQTGELVRALDDEAPRIADKETPENWKSMKRAMGSVARLAFSPDGSLLAVCGASFEDYSDIFDGVDSLGRSATGPGRLKVWEVKTGKLKHDLAGHSHAYDVAFSADGTLLTSAGRWVGNEGNGTGVITWNSETGKKVTAIAKEANGGVHTVAFSPTRKMVAIGARNYDKENDTSSTAVSVAFPMSGITEWQQTVACAVRRIAFLPGGTTVAALCGGESIRFIDVETGQLKHEIKATDSPNKRRWSDFAIPGKGGILVIGGASGERQGSVEVWELEGAGGGDDRAPAKADDESGKRGTNSKEGT